MNMSNADGGFLYLVKDEQLHSSLSNQSLNLDFDVKPTGRHRFAPYPSQKKKKPMRLCCSKMPFRHVPDVYQHRVRLCWQKSR